ncbi:MAG: hypothetical protein U0L72_11090, partial [Acutalibacteraceae bacterium]|nr:hypothetical protein [Acutalibacteraceae bacterium]
KAQNAVNPDGFTSILTKPQQKILVSKSDSSLNALAKLNNEKCYIFRNYHENTLKLQQVLCDIENKYDNCVVAEATTIWESIIKSKDAEDYLSNNINHANDFWAKTTAQIITATIEKI